MKVLIVNTYDRGGAANACLRLHEGLLDAGIDSRVLLKYKEKSIPQTFEFKKNKQRLNKVQHLKNKVVLFLLKLGILKKASQSENQLFLTQRKAGLELFSFPDTNCDITTSPLYKEADIINLHWVANFLDYESFFRKNTKPVVWTLHDMNPFTGGEHYSEKFLGMDTFGYPISREITDKENSVFKRILSLKVKAIQSVSNINIVAPSQWMMKEAEQSQVFKLKKMLWIPYGINSEIYQPRDKNFSRNILNIPQDKAVILFVADSLSNHRKGYVYLKKAFDMMERDDLVLCAIGRKNIAFENSKNIIELGSIFDSRLMSIVYSAADVFVIPSLMDNLPNTVIESLMCGTPVIGFPIGGVCDMIKEGENGFLTKTINSAALQETIEMFLNSPKSFDRNAIRESALEKYDLKVQADNYIELFKNALHS